MIGAAPTRRVSSVLGRMELGNVAATGKAQSDDLVDTAGSAAWLFDGASAHDDPAACDAHDASWFVQQLSQSLGSELSKSAERELRHTFATAIARVSARHAQLCPHVRSGHGPLAAAVIVRRRHGALEYLILGDSALLVQSGDGQVNHHSDKRLSTVAADLRGAIQQGLQGGRGYDDAVHDARTRALRTTERATRNRDGGYWIAGDDPGAALHSLTGRYSLSDTAAGVSRFALISDGLERAVTHLNCYAGWSELIENLFDPGILATITRIRGAELADPDGLRHPRSKPSDDAAAITCAPSRD